MKLTDLIHYLKDEEKLDQLFIDEGLNTDSEAIIICMKDSLDLESEIKLFEMEKTGGALSFEKEGAKYVELFPAYHAMEIVESYFALPEEKNYSNVEMAQRLLKYRIKDA